VRPAWHLALLALLAGLLLFVGLGATALTDRDEGSNAEAAREMLERGSRIIPTLNYAPRFAKPALVYWLMAGLYATIGIGEVAARLPSAVAVTLLVGLVYAFARWALGAPAALRAALILLLSLEVAALGRMALTDATLMLWTTAAAFAFFRAHAGDPPRGRWYLAMGVALGFGMLTKGPVGLLIPLMGIVPFLLVAGGWRRLWGEARLGWVIALGVLVAAPWYAAMLWQHGSEYAEGARAQTLERVFRTVTGPGGTVLFYVPVMLVGFFPWSAFLPGAVVRTLRRPRARATGGRAEAVAVFAAVWIVSGIAAFSLFQSRLPHYVAPLFPAAALLLTITWPARVPAATRGLLATLGLTLGGALLAAGLLGQRVAGWLARAYPAAPDASLPVSTVLVAGLVLAIGAAAAVRDGARLFVALAALTAALLAVGFHVALPRFSDTYVAPAAHLIQQAAAAARPCDDLVVLGPDRPSLVFYARQPVTFAKVEEAATLDAVIRPSGRLFLVVPRAGLDRLPPALAGLPAVDARGGYALLVSAGAGRPC
jgi:4-amino-4-deoxy-L-arabinose transferase-like glycosyltransferase